MKVTGVDFITVPTRDFEEADRFYGDVLGLERSKQWGSMPAREYETGSLTIVLMQSDAFGLEFERHSGELSAEETASAQRENNARTSRIVLERPPRGGGALNELWRSLIIALMQSDAFGIEFERHSHPIALHVDDVEAGRAELESKGIEFVADTMDSGVCHMAHFRDPDGNALMLHHRYAP